MKKIKTTFALFFAQIAIGVFVMLIIMIFTRNEAIAMLWFQAIMGSIGIIAFYIITWRRLKSESSKKKLIKYSGIILAEYSLIHIISYIINVSITGTWLTLVWADIISVTAIIIALDIAKSIKATNESVSEQIYFYLIFYVLILVIANLFFIPVLLYASTRN